MDGARNRTSEAHVFPEFGKTSGDTALAVVARIPSPDHSIDAEVWNENRMPLARLIHQPPVVALDQVEEPRLVL